MPSRYEVQLLRNAFLCSACSDQCLVERTGPEGLQGRPVQVAGVSWEPAPLPRREGSGGSRVACAVWNVWPFHREQATVLVSTRRTLVLLKGLFSRIFFCKTLFKSKLMCLFAVSPLYNYVVCVSYRALFAELHFSFYANRIFKTQMKTDASRCRLH